MLLGEHLPVPICTFGPWGPVDCRWDQIVSLLCSKLGHPLNVPVYTSLLSLQVPRGPPAPICGIPQAEETFFPLLCSIGSLITYSQNTSFYVSTKICFAREFGWSWTCHPPSHWANVENTSQFFQNIPDPKICSVLFSRQITIWEGRHQYFLFFWREGCQLFVRSLIILPSLRVCRGEFCSKFLQAQGREHGSEMVALCVQPWSPFPATLLHFSLWCRNDPSFLPCPYHATFSRAVSLSERLNLRNTQEKRFQNPNGHPLVKREYSNNCFRGVYWAGSTPEIKTKQRTKTNKQKPTRQGLPDCETGIFREIPNHSWLLCPFISEINPRNIWRIGKGLPLHLSLEMPSLPQVQRVLSTSFICQRQDEFESFFYSWPVSAYDTSMDSVNRGWNISKNNRKMCQYWACADSFLIMLNNYLHNFAIISGVISNLETTHSE